MCVLRNLLSSELRIAKPPTYNVWYKVQTSENWSRFLNLEYSYISWF
jgi:hypothetical protein